MTARSIDIIETLRKISAWRVDERYAGPKPARWMRGATYVAVEIPAVTDLFMLGRLLAPFELGEPKINATATGWMVFWPDLTSPTQSEWDAFHDQQIIPDPVDE